MRTLTSRQCALFGGVITIALLDVALTAYLLFVRSGFGEGNPIFAWAVGNPPMFIAIVIAVKIAGIGTIIAITGYMNSRDITLNGTAAAISAWIASVGIFLIMVGGLI